MKTKNNPKAGLLVVLILLCFFSKSDLIAQSEPITWSLKVSNPLEFSRTDEVLLLPKSIVSQKFGAESHAFTVTLAGQELPSQWNEAGPDQGLLILLPQIDANQNLELVVSNQQSSQSFPKRTQAELSHKFGGHFENREYIGGHFENVQSLKVPAEHTDHSWFIRYEGPGWESDLVGYRFYLDWRNGIDVFGKKVHTPVLQGVGQDGFDSYHEPADWGMDVLKVGETLGLGSIATWENGKARRVDETDSLYAEITTNGSIYSSILTQYYGWNLPGGKTDIQSEISIHAGTRLSRIDLTSSAAIANFATGLIKDAKAELIKSGADLAYGYLATYGKQSLAEDKLGIAVIYPTAQVEQITEDALSHVVVLSGEKKQLSYYILAAWEQELDGITSQEEFKAYLDQEILKLSHPLQLSY